MSRGWSAAIALSCLLCLIVRGISRTRTRMVKAMMLRPKLLKKISYNSTRPLIIGWMIMRFQMSQIISTG